VAASASGWLPCAVCIGCDALADNVCQRKLRARWLGDNGSTPGEALAPRQWKQWAGPTPEERLQMDAHGIVFEHGYYRYGAYRYDLLPAALD